MKKLLIFSSLFLLGCASQGYESNSIIQLGTADGCHVFRLIDNASYRYFVICPAQGAYPSIVAGLP